MNETKSNFCHEFKRKSISFNVLRIFSDWVFWARKVVSAIKHHTASMDVDCCAAVAAIRHEYGTSKRNANADSSGVVMSNARCAITKEKSTFATRKAIKKKKNENN